MEQKQHLLIIIQLAQMVLPADYMRDHKKALQEGLDVLGYQLDGVYINGDNNKLASYKTYFIEVRDKSKNIVGYYHAVVSYEEDKAPVFRFYDKATGEAKLAAYQKQGDLSKERNPSTDDDNM